MSEFSVYCPFSDKMYLNLNKCIAQLPLSPDKSSCKIFTGEI